MIDKQWVEFEGDRTVPLIFPIIDLPCTAVEHVRVSVDSAGCLVAEWDSVDLQDEWVVAYRHATTVEYDTVSSCRWERCGVDLAEDYNISVQSRCITAMDHKWSGWSRASSSLGIRSANTITEHHITLTPNPASGECRVSCGGERMESIELVDAAGRTLLHQALGGATEHTVDTRNLPQGVYTVRIETAAGGRVGKLAVRR